MEENPIETELKSTQGKEEVSNIIKLFLFVTDVVA